MPQIEDDTAEIVIGSQFDIVHQDAPNAAENDVCEEQARDLEITHLPVDPPTPRVWRCGPWFYIADGVRCGATATTEAEAWQIWEAHQKGQESPLVVQLAAMEDDEFAAWFASYESVSLADAVERAFAELPRTRPDPTTGEVKGWQLTDKRVIPWLEATYPKRYAGWSPRAIAARIRRVRNDLRWAMAREVRSMPAEELKGRREAVHKSIIKLERKAAEASDPAIRQSWEAQAASKRGMLALYVKETERRATWTPRAAAEPGKCVLSRAAGPPARSQVQP
jgi:hypothetical protein